MANQTQRSIDRKAGAPLADWMTEDPKKFGIPLFLQVQNRRPLTNDQRTRLEARLAKAREPDLLRVRDDRAVRERIEAERREKKLRGLKNRTDRVRREGKPVPGSRWDVNLSRWVHPAEVKKSSGPKSEGEPKMAKKQKSGFSPLRTGTTRAKIVQLALASSKTATQLATGADIDRKTLLTHLYCLERDSGIGYEIGEDDRVTLKLPAGVTEKNVFKEASAPAKSKKAEKKAA